MNGTLRAGIVDRVQLTRVADGLAAAVAVSLPWSTTATGILIPLWLIAVVPTLDISLVRRELATAAGGLPVLLWALAAISMLWADNAWSERLGELGGYHKLLLLPLLLAQFRRSQHGDWAILGFFASAFVLLIVSWGLALIPGLPWRGKMVGVPVKDYVLQSEVFAICAFALLGRTVEAWRARRPQLATALLALAAIFILNVAYVATARTTLVVLAALLVLFGFRQFGWKGTSGVCVAGGVLAGLLWGSSPYLRDRIDHAVEDVQLYRATGEGSPVGLRLAFWTKSIDFIAGAPVIGHGTGMMRELYRRAAIGETGAAAVATVNPHNQILGVAIQLGLVGVLVLVAMWVAHLALFRGGGLTAWFGLVVVIQHVVSSLFNSHLFDFTQGWLYVFAVGVLGGMALQKAEPLPKLRSHSPAAAIGAR